jgi:hypothetical protein
MLLNGQRDKRFLEGKEEAEAFKNKEFIRMNSSTICKVEFSRHVVRLALMGKLRTSGRSVASRVDRLLESRWSRSIALFGSIVGFGAIIYKAAKILHDLLP